jgi:hypothetical protein
MPPMPRWLSGLLATVVLVAAVSGLLVLVEPHAPALSLSVLYLLAVVPVAIVWGVRQAMVASLLSTTAFAYLFLPPRRSLEVEDSRSLLVLLALLLTSVVVGELAARLRRGARASARLAEEQVALRRVATLVAQSAAPAEVFEAVTREVGLRSGADLARMERYEADGTVTGVARWGREGDPLAVGTRIPLEGVNIAALVWPTGPSGASGQLRSGLRSDRGGSSGARDPLVGRLPNRGRRAAVGSDRRVVQARDAVPSGYRVTDGGLHRAGGHGDRQCGEPLGAGRLPRPGGRRRRRDPAAYRAGSP